MRKLRREKLLDALEDPPEGLEDLRTALLNDHAWKLEKGLV